MAIPTLIGVPYDASSSFARGAALGPGAIRAALHSSATNWWSESGVNVQDTLADAGDVELPDINGMEAVANAIRALPKTATPIVLGGDHSITVPVVRAIAERHGPIHVLVFDAHGDLYPEFQGDPNSHACVFARILEAGHAKSVTQVGVRTLNAVQMETAKRHGVRHIDMRAWARGERPKLAGPLYLSIDIDGFDPAFAPGVAHREPGGLAPRDVIGIIQSLDVPIVGADVVELNPTFDPAGITAPLAAKLVKELSARLTQS